MEENKTKIIENSWLLFGLQVIFVLILTKLNFQQLSINQAVAHTIELFLIIFSLYSIIISIKNFVKLGKRASAGYILLIISSIILLMFSHYMLPWILGW